MNKPVPDPIIADYIKELRTPCVVSTSHYTLRDLYRKHGAEYIDTMLQKYWKEERECATQSQ